MNKISPATYRKYADDPAAFRNDLLIDVDGKVCRFGDVMDDWQRNDFQNLDQGMLRCIGHSDDPTAKLRYMYERPRGHSKTTDIAVLCIWLMVFATRPLKGFCLATDKDQASILKEAMGTIIRLNPWLATLLEVRKLTVNNIAKGHAGQGSTLAIFTSDVGSSYGILPDFIIADELTHWAGDGSLWHSLISSAAKRSNCLLCVISNAGFCESWQWAVREAAREDNNWYFSRLDGPQASWMTPDRLLEQRKMLPEVAFNRLWMNQWSTGGGDALTPSDIAAAFLPDLQPMTGSEKGYVFVAGVDLGLTRDCSAVVVLGVQEGGHALKIRLAHHKLWRPTLGKKINLLEVERHILDLDEQFGLEFVCFDPWQAEHLAQTLEADSGHSRRNLGRRFYNQPWLIETVPVAATLRAQASLVIESFTDRRLQLFPCEPLRRDLLKLRVEEKQSGGFRLTSPRDGEGHGDSFSAFALALLQAHELAGKSPIAVSVSTLSQGSGATPYQAALAHFEFRQQQYAREQEQLSNSDDSLEELRIMMRRLNRH